MIAEGLPCCEAGLIADAGLPPSHVCVTADAMEVPGVAIFVSEPGRCIPGAEPGSCPGGALPEGAADTGDARTGCSTGPALTWDCARTGACAAACSGAAGAVDCGLLGLCSCICAGGACRWPFCDTFSLSALVKSASCGAAGLNTVDAFTPPSGLAICCASVLTGGSCCCSSSAGAACSGKLCGAAMPLLRLSSAEGPVLGTTSASLFNFTWVPACGGLSAVTWFSVALETGLAREGPELDC